MLMKRRGLNFVTEHHEELLDQQVIEACETQLDNVAPKIVAILGLSESANTEEVRNALVRSCLVFGESQKSKKQDKKDEEELMEEEEAFGTQFKAYLCPNPASSTNMSSRKQRLIFLQIDRNDPYSILDVCKIADLVIGVMSCRYTQVGGLKQDPFEHAKAIDEIGYRALHLVRSQGMPSLIGVLQHVEYISSSKQSQVKKLFQRMFTSEFTDKYKFMMLNNVNDNQNASDSNAVLRQIAVTFPQAVTWKENRSYMLGEVCHVREDEVHIKGYIRQNFINAKRLVHLTGLPVLSWKIKRIEFATDPCPVKLSQKEKDKVLSTSRAQSIVSSRNASREASRRSSRKGSFEEMKTDDVEEVKDETTKIKCVQKAKAKGDDARDDDAIVNNPGAFAAE